MFDLKKIKFFLFDMDGTLYLGDRLFPFTVPLLETIRKQGKKYLFMTNNSSKSVADYVKKLEKLGISASREDFITSSQATAYYLHKHHPDCKLYVMGTASLKKELADEGFAISETYAEDITCVVSGFDTELTFQKLEDMSRLLLKDIPYIATNPDWVCPTEFGYVPDCGSMSEMLCHATGKMPAFIGKPSPLMPQLAMEKWGYTPEESMVIGDRIYTDIKSGLKESMVIGDRIYTDIKSGLNAGIAAALVLSGETTPEILAQSKDKPTVVFLDCGELLQQLRKLE